MQKWLIFRFTSYICSFYWWLKISISNCDTTEKQEHTNWIHFASACRLPSIMQKWFSNSRLQYSVHHAITLIFWIMCQMHYSLTPGTDTVLQRVNMWILNTSMKISYLNIWWHVSGQGNENRSEFHYICFWNSYCHGANMLRYGIFMIIDAVHKIIWMKWASVSWSIFFYLNVIENSYLITHFQTTLILFNETMSFGIKKNWIKINY